MTSDDDIGTGGALPAATSRVPVPAGSPAAERNRLPILEQLRHLLPESGRVLEIASGTGQHVVCFAAALPGLQWLPSDPAADMRASIEARVAAAGLGNVAAPLDLDAAAANWPALVACDAVVCINMIHIAPWSATEGLFRHAAALLAPGASLTLYGPFRRNGRHTAASNEAFERWLKQRDHAWGVRDVGDVDAVARGSGFAAGRIVEMPANNLIVNYRRL